MVLAQASGAAIHGRLSGGCRRGCSARSSGDMTLDRPSKTALNGVEVEFGRGLSDQVRLIRPSAGPTSYCQVPTECRKEWGSRSPRRTGQGAPGSSGQTAFLSRMACSRAPRGNAKLPRSRQSPHVDPSGSGVCRDLPTGHPSGSARAVNFPRGHPSGSACSVKFSRTALPRFPRGKSAPWRQASSVRNFR